MEPPASGLCAHCKHGRLLRNPRGSVFQRCERASSDGDFPAYPPLPVRACAGYEEAPKSPDAPEQ
ncbi:MAG: hypothetical protein NZ990_09600 [Myxococcota bacterium]|nr:hypothetical protein [Myxococcota bacterium]